MLIGPVHEYRYAIALGNGGSVAVAMAGGEGAWTGCGALRGRTGAYTNRHRTRHVPGEG
jgi:hypothetical protein